MPSITWPQAVDEALCFGWIDGVRKNLDAGSYKIRFTPRIAGSIWSTVNIKRAQELAAAGLMRSAGLRAFERRSQDKSRVYSYEQKKSAEPGVRKETEGESRGVGVFPAEAAVVSARRDLVVDQREAGGDAPAADGDADRGLRARPDDRTADAKIRVGRHIMMRNQLLAACLVVALISLPGALRAQSMPSAAPSPSGGMKGFRGVLNVNGVGIAFDSPACGNAIRRAMAVGHAVAAPSDFCSREMALALSAAAQPGPTVPQASASAQHTPSARDP